MQLLAAYLILLVSPVFQLPTTKKVPCPYLVVAGEAIKEVRSSRLSHPAAPLTSSQMIYRKDLFNNITTWQHLTTYPLTASAMQNEWVRWSEYESRKRLDSFSFGGSITRV
jgi:hypothetical protein